MAFQTSVPIRHSSFTRTSTASLPLCSCHSSPPSHSRRRPSQKLFKFRRHAISAQIIRSTPPSVYSDTSSSPTSRFPDVPTIGFIGLGVMGLPMALNLASVFPRLVVWNRTPKLNQLLSEQARSLSDNASHGGYTPPCDITAADTARAVIQQCDITFTMLSTPAAVKAVLHDGPAPALEAMVPGKALVDCSTLRIEDMRNTARQVTDRGGLFLEAPVSGSKLPAEQGQLIFMCGGSRQLFDDPIIQKALDVMGKSNFFLGNVGSATKMKLIINQLMFTMLAALGESIVLTEAMDLSVDDLLKVLSLGALSNPMFALKGPNMKRGAVGYDTHFPLELARKDTHLAQALGIDQGISMNVSNAAHDWYKTSNGLDRADCCAVVEKIRSSTSR